MAPRIVLERWTSLRWLEKVWMCVDFGQLYALLWVAAQPWPWPYLWVDWTSWTVWMNIDYFSLTKDGALYGQTGNVGISKWGQMEHYLYYALAFSLLPSLVAAPLLLRRAMSPRQRSFTKMAVLLIWQLLYLPCGLGVFRLYYCEGNGTLSADPTISCSSSKYLMYTAISTVLVAPLILGLPVYMYYCTHDLVVYNFRHDHEKRLQAWEIMYGLSLDDFWLEAQAWLVSSFKRSGVYFRVLMLALKLALLLIFIFVRSSLFLQAGLYLLCTIAFCLPAMRYRPFRLLSSNLTLLVLIFTLLVATTTGMMNAAGVENAAMVASRQSFFLWALFSFSVLLLGGVFLWSQFVLRDDWPSALTIGRINDSDMRSMVSKWIAAMAEASYVVSDCLRSVAEIKDLTDFNRVASLVRACWLSARSNGSLFEVMLGDVLDRLLIFHKVFYVPKNLRRNREYLHEALLEAGESLLHRERGTILMSRRKRSILTKMTALRAFLGGRVLDDSFAQLHNSLPRSSSGPTLAMGARAESVASLHIFDGDLLPAQSSDWGAERDRTETILANLSVTVALTEALLQAEDPSARYQELLSVRDLWTEVVGLLDAGRVVQADLQEALTAEDCYTYRRLVEDCLARFDLGGDEEAGSGSHMWSEDNLADVIGARPRGGSTDYGSSVDGPNEHLDLGSMVGSIEEGDSEDYSEEPTGSLPDSQPEPPREASPSGFGQPAASAHSAQRIFGSQMPRALAPLQPALPARATPEGLPAARGLLLKEPTPVQFKPRGVEEEHAAPEPEPKAWKPARLDPLLSGGVPPAAAPLATAEDSTSARPESAPFSPTPEPSPEPAEAAVTPQPTRSRSDDMPRSEEAQSRNASEKNYSPLAYNLDEDIVIEGEEEQEEDDLSLALSVEPQPRPAAIDTEPPPAGLLDDRMANPFELTPRRQGSDDSLDLSVHSED